MLCLRGFELYSRWVPRYIPFNVKSSQILAALLIHSISLDQAKIFANFLLSLFRGIKQNLLHSHEFNLP